MDISPQYLFLSIVLGLVIGWGCSYLAQQRGRDPKVWFLVGFFFGLLGLIVLMIIPNLKTEEVEKTELEEEQITISDPDVETKEWYYLDSEAIQSGPVTLACLKQLFEDKKISSISYVWSEGMEEWKTIEECDLFTS